MKIKVLLLGRELHLGGSERQISEMARNLDRSRFEAHVGCFRPEGLRGEELRAAGVPVVVFPVRSFLSIPALKGAWQLVRYIRENNIDVVHTFDYPLTAFAVPIARACTRAAVISSVRAHRGLVPGIYAWLIPQTDRWVDAVVVNCEFLKHHLVNDYAIAPDRIQLCYNGIDLTQFYSGPSRRPDALPTGSLVVGVVCALRPEKGLLTLLDAFERVRNVSSLRLVIVGSGEMLQPLQAHAGNLGISDLCIFEPATPWVADWMRAIDIFVLPSLSEALSNSLMEAMACGCCAVASNTGANPELVVDGDNGLLFEPGNAEALADVLRMLIGNEARRRELAAKAARRIRDDFSVASSAERLGEIYDQVLNLRRA